MQSDGRSATHLLAGTVLTFINLDDFLPHGNCVIFLAQVLCQGPRLALSIPHIDGDLVGLNLQQDIVLIDNVTCRQYYLQPKL